MKTRDLHNKIVLHWQTHVVAWVAKDYWWLYDSASGHSSNGPTDTSSKHSSSLMHCLLSLSAALQQLGVVSLGPQKRDEITREALYSLVEVLVDPAVKRVSETWHRSNLLFVRKMLDAWDPTWSQTTGTWQTRLKKLTSVCLAASDNPNDLTFLPGSRERAGRITDCRRTCADPNAFGVLVPVTDWDR